MQADGKSAGPALLEVRGVTKEFVSGGLFMKPRRTLAAQGISFDVRRGEAVALVGESGSGKSTVARLLMRLEAPDAGEIRLAGRNVLASEPRRASLAYRGQVQMVFQDPFGSLNPVHSVAHHIERPLLRHGVLSRRPGGDGQVQAGSRTSRAAVRGRILELLRTVGLEPAEEFVDRHPDELSGGQRQRVAIARALAVEPELLVADEPTSMLDVSIRMDVLNLLARLRSERGLAILLITHDLASARYLADRILVLFRGRIVEDGPSRAIIESPAHPYTRALLASIADATKVAHARKRPAEPRTLSQVGCPFAARCPEVHETCRTTDPMPRTVDGTRVRCHLYPADRAVPES